jgi:hypothetical protein
MFQVDSEELPIVQQSWGRVPHSPPPVENDKRVINRRSPSIDEVDDSGPMQLDSPARSLSPHSGSKRPHTTDDETDSDIEVADIHVSKTPKIERKKMVDPKLEITTIRVRSWF